jgi:RNA polymerase sigma-70 factor (sigma-E family)
VENPATTVQRRGGRELVTKGIDHRLNDLYAAHAAGIRRMAYLITGDAHAAEDLLQEAFVRVGGRLLTLRDPEGAAGYLYRTVMNLARDHGRRLRRDRALNRRVAPAPPVPPNDVETADEVWSALLKLPIRHRAVLFFRYYMDLSEAQTADVLGCSVSAVKSLNHRASESLRKQLQGDVT